MFPARGDWEGVARAKAICASCPVIEQCLDFISRNPERYGVWAGIAGKEITEERKRRRIDPRQVHTRLLRDETCRSVAQPRPAAGLLGTGQAEERPGIALRKPHARAVQQPQPQTANGTKADRLQDGDSTDLR